MGSSKPDIETYTHQRDAGVDNIEYVRAAGLDPVVMEATVKRVSFIAVICSVLLVVIVPAIATSARVWTPAGLGAWTYLGLIWLFWSIVAVGLLPLWEARAELMTVFGGILHLRPAAAMQ